MRLGLTRLLTILVLGSTAVTHGQDSHIPPPNEQRLPQDVRAILDSRRNGPKKNPFDDQLLEKLKQSMPPGIDPAKFDAKKIQQILRDHPELTEKENLARLQDLVKQQLQTANAKDEPGLKNLEKLLQKVDLKKLGDPKDYVLPHTNPSVEPPQPASPTPQPRPKLNEQLTNSFSQWALQNFGDTPEAHNLIDDFVKMMGEGSKSDEFQEFLKDSHTDLKSIFDPNDMPSWNLGDLTGGLKLFDLPKMTPSAPSSDRSTSIRDDGDTFSSGDSSNLSVVVFVLTFLIVGGVLYWRMKKNPAANETSGTQNAVWQLDPTTLTTREDVVKAFDSLSVTKCGTAAINWHHRQVADHLANKEPEKLEAVNQLASLYEKARYAPLSEPFTDGDMAEARIRLTQVGELSAHETVAFWMPQQR